VEDDPLILDRLSSSCPKLSDLVEVWRSCNKNNFACFFETRCRHPATGNLSDTYRKTEYHRVTGVKFGVDNRGSHRTSNFELTKFFAGMSS